MTAYRRTIHDSEPKTRTPVRIGEEPEERGEEEVRRVKERREEESMVALEVESLLNVTKLEMLKQMMVQYQDSSTTLLQDKFNKLSTQVQDFALAISNLTEVHDISNKFGSTSTTAIADVKKSNATLKFKTDLNVLCSFTPLTPLKMK
ncbi:hypothetical protein L6452_09412 [Arctium lappa]|uniref:Uncharacterized protein n=1 Tax=Arctium lappa TaxID=4217 RepID=A0ACB9DKA5_ARCLA|nr:hypothetical protein L6452_09412 [Arctium lappa]